MTWRARRGQGRTATQAAAIYRVQAAGELDGIRVDHPDGLRDPATYPARLRAAAPAAWLLVEKILEYGEELPDWPVDGTTGYDALADVCGLFVHPSAEPAFSHPAAGQIDRFRWLARHRVVTPRT